MGNVYDAYDSEIEAARKVFGARVDEVVFYDPDFPGEGDPWLAVALDADGRQIGTRTGDEVGEGLVELFRAISSRGETVKFWLSIGGLDEDDEPECEGHESLDGAHMGETVFCDGSCV